MEDASGVDVIFEAIDSVVFRPEVNFETVVLLGLVNELLCDVSRRFVALNAGKKYLANIRQVLVAYYADFATPFHVPLLHRSAVG